LACGVTGIRCRKLNVDRAEFGRLASAAHRRLATKLLKFFHRGTSRNLKRRPDRAGRDCVDSRVLRELLLAEIGRHVDFQAYAFVLTDPETEVGSDPLADVPSWASVLVSASGGAATSASPPVTRRMRSAAIMLLPH